MRTALFNTTATVTPTTWATQADGSVARSDGTAVSNVPCRINAMSGRETARLGREFGTTMFDGFFPMTLGDGTALALTLDAKVVSGGVTYRVKGPPVNQGGAGQLYQVTLEVDQ